jgi:regulator of protease activity HflC (stomatin/prohibitin superfamily)
MKKILSVLSAFLIFTTFSCTTTDSSEVALVVDQIGNDKGVPNVQMESGVIFYFPPTQDVFTYSTAINHKEWTVSPTKYSEGLNAIEITSSEGAAFNIDVALDTQLNRASAADVFRKYRIDLDDIMDTRIKALVRKELVLHSTKYTTDSLLQYKSNYEAEVTSSLRKVLEKEGFNLSNISVASLHLPKAYRNAINRKIQVIQQTATIKSQTEQAQQEALRRVAVAKGNFEAAQYDARTKEIMSQPKMLELYKAETDRIWAQKGKSPYGQNNVFGANSGILLSR